MKTNLTIFIFGIAAFSGLSAAEECPFTPPVNLSGKQVLAFKMDSEQPKFLNLADLEKLPQTSITSETRNKTADSTNTPDVQSVT